MNGQYHLNVSEDVVLTLGGSTSSTPFSILFYTCSDSNCLTCTYVPTTHSGSVCTVCMMNTTITSGVCVSNCGDGIVEVYNTSPYINEVCDNTDFNSKCCSSNCQSFNAGYYTNPSSPSTNSSCEADCCTNPTDGIVAGNETCDDGNNNPDDGCYNN